MTPSVMKNDKSWRGMLLKVILSILIIISTFIIALIFNIIVIVVIVIIIIIIIQDNEGDWGVAVAAWRGMKKGQPGVPGNLIIIVIIVIIITGPRPAFGRLGQGGSSGGYSSHK